MADEQRAGGHEASAETVEAADEDLGVGAEAADDLLLLVLVFGGGEGVALVAGRAAGAGTQGDEGGVGVGDGVAGVRLVDDETALFGDEVGVDDVHVHAGGAGY